MQVIINFLLCLTLVLCVAYVGGRKPVTKKCKPLVFKDTTSSYDQEPNEKGLYPKGTICTLNCREGCVKDTGGTQRKCKVRGRTKWWTGGRGLKCLCKPCEIPAIPNAGAAPEGPCFNTSSADAGTTCSFQCDPGYVDLAGDTNMTCVNGRWTGLNLDCEAVFQLAKEAFEQQLGEDISAEVGLSDFWDALDALNDLEPDTIVTGNITDKLTLHPSRWKMVYNEPSGLPISLYTSAFEEFDVDAFFHENERNRVARSLGSTTPPEVVTEDFLYWFESLPVTLELAPPTEMPNLGPVLSLLGQDFSDLFGESADNSFSLSDLNNVEINDNFRMELYRPTIEYRDGGLGIEVEVNVNFDGFNGVEVRSLYSNGNLDFGIEVRFDQDGNFDQVFFGFVKTF